MPGSDKSIWQHIKDAIGKLLGIPVEQQSALSHVLEHGMNLTAQERPNSHGEVPQRQSSAPKDEGVPPPTPHSFAQRIFGKLQATNDKVAAKFPVLGQAFNRFAEARQQLVAPKTVTLVDLGKYPQAMVDRVYNLYREAYRNGTVPTMTPKEQEISKLISDYYGKIADIRRNVGIKIGGREAGKNQ